MVPYMPEAIQNFDFSVLNWIQNNIANPVCDVFFKYITHLGGLKGLFCIALAVIFVCFKKTRKTGAMIGVALLLGVIIGNAILKNVFLRVRPYDCEQAMVAVKDLLNGPEKDTSFPSGHTLAIFETATVLMYWNRKWGIPALIIALCVAFSRMYLYVHFPTDVLGGAVLGIIHGILAIIIVNLVYKYIVPKFTKKKAIE